MAELDIHLRISPGLIRLALPCLILAAFASDLSSESVTLSTYYPAPSGVYTKMITTGQTVLARDGGSVGIGTAAPTTTLDVRGNARVSGYQIVGGGLSAGGVWGTNYVATSGGVYSYSSGTSFYGGGNANVNDVYLRSIGRYASSLGGLRIVGSCGIGYGGGSCYCGGGLAVLMRFDTNGRAGHCGATGGGWGACDANAGGIFVCLN
ncbi:MAG: hypothetical protein KGO96_04745 [Elusimicrobia bacterium]|nr:hypothetical protein [Elusimicrobiota bacterium]MDE2425199.1 hypothetical protein [Elusimicrobiota bacterium]